MGSVFEYWHYVEISGAGRPLLRENERDIYVEQFVGLYHGKVKVLNKQKGRIYLTSQRIIYVDDTDPWKESVCIELDDVLNIDYSSKFLKRSAKVIIFLKAFAGGERTNGQNELGSTSWQCPICQYNNVVPFIVNETEQSMPCCENCGITVDREMAKDSIKNLIDKVQTKNDRKNRNICPICTFLNHPQMRNCEICGSRLSYYQQSSALSDNRVKFQLENDGGSNSSASFAQLSFRRSDGSLFYEALEKCLETIARTQSKHLFNQNVVSINGVPVEHPIDPDLVLLTNDISLIGINALEKKKEHQLLKNDILMSNALSDLNKLMALATDIEYMYKGESKNTNCFKNQQILVVDRDKYLNKESFLEEIAREIYGFVDSELRGEDGAIVTMVDLYALYNKFARIGTGLVSPQEMRDACEKFTSLGLNELKLMKINGRVLCLAFEDSFNHIKTRIVQYITMKPGSDIAQITNEFNRYDKSNWSMGVIGEILEHCLNLGELVVDQQISGVNYYFNSFWKY